VDRDYTRQEGLDSLYVWRETDAARAKAEKAGAQLLDLAQLDADLNGAAPRRTLGRIEELPGRE